jgi:hypothetical protein
VDVVNGEYVPRKSILKSRSRENSVCSDASESSATELEERRVPAAGSEASESPVDGEPQQDAQPRFAGTPEVRAVHPLSFLSLQHKDLCLLGKHLAPEWHLNLWGFLFSFSDSILLYLAWAGLKLVTLLLLPPSSWYYRHMLLHLASCSVFDQFLLFNLKSHMISLILCTFVLFKIIICKTD